MWMISLTFLQIVKWVSMRIFPSFLYMSFPPDIFYISINIHKSFIHQLFTKFEFQHLIRVSNGLYFIPSPFWGRISQWGCAMWKIIFNVPDFCLLIHNSWCRILLVPAQYDPSAKRKEKDRHQIYVLTRNILKSYYIFAISKPSKLSLS